MCIRDSREMGVVITEYDEAIKIDATKNPLKRCNIKTMVYYFKLFFIIIPQLKQNCTTFIKKLLISDNLIYCLLYTSKAYRSGTQNEKGRQGNNLRQKRTRLPLRAFFLRKQKRNRVCYTR